MQRSLVARRGSCAHLCTCSEDVRDTRFIWSGGTNRSIWCCYFRVSFFFLFYSSLSCPILFVKSCVICFLDPFVCPTCPVISCPVLSLPFVISCPLSFIVYPNAPYVSYPISSHAFLSHQSLFLSYNFLSHHLLSCKVRSVV